MKKYWDDLHQQLFQRSRDLDYLQWMQRNSARYIAGAIILTLLSTSLYTLRPERVRQQLQADNQPAFQDTILQTDGMQQIASTDKTPLRDRVMKEEAITTEATRTEETEAPSLEPTYINPMELSVYMVPGNGTLQYGYGIGYDELYDDYRFHTEVCYAAGNGEVLACTSGTITQVQLQDQWQITVQCADGIVQYAGLNLCSAQVGDSVTAGEIIGTAMDKLYVRAYHL